MILAVPPWAAAEEVKNGRQIFDQVPVCDAYLAFLAGEDTGPAEECHQLARFLLARQDAALVPFLTELRDVASERSALFAVSATGLAVIRGDARVAYQSSEIATTRILVKMGMSQDEERAALYGYLLSEIRLQSVTSLCQAGKGCDALGSAWSIAEMLGARFAGLDDRRPDFVMLCLLRTDAYLVPVRDVLASPRFGACLLSG